MNNKKPKFENGGSIGLQMGSFQLYKPITPKKINLQESVSPVVGAS